MTKKTQLIYSLISVCAVLAYGGFLVKNSIHQVDTVEETLPYELIEDEQAELVTEPWVEEVPVHNNVPAPLPTESATQPLLDTDEIKGFSPVFPVNGEVIGYFSTSPSYTKTTKDWRTHTGIDISAPVTESVFSIEDGTVTACYTDPMWGNVIEIDHGEYVSIYKNLSTLIMVKKGDSVTRGEKISGVGQSSVAERGEAHLHFELTHYSEYIDPMELFG